MKIPVLTEISGKILQRGVQGETANELQELIESESKVVLHDETVTHQEDLLDHEAYAQIVYLLLTTTWILSWLPLVKRNPIIAFMMMSKTRLSKFRQWTN